MSESNPGSPRKNVFEGLEQPLPIGAFGTDRDVAIFSIALSLKRIADNTDEIRTSLRFITERWGSR
jgi:hypothetical protein